MALDLAQRLQSLGLAAEAGIEVQRQIEAGTSNINALLEVGFAPLDATNLAAGITAGTVDADLLSEGSIIPAIAVEIAEAINTVPVNTVAPVLSGTPEVSETLSVTDGIWDSQSALTYSYVWYADGVVIAGADEDTYLLTASEEDADITVDVTATNANGSATATSNALGPVVA